MSLSHWSCLLSLRGSLNLHLLINWLFNRCHMWVFGQWLEWLINRKLVKLISVRPQPKQCINTENSNDTFPWVSCAIQAMHCQLNDDPLNLCHYIIFRLCYLCCFWTNLIKTMLSEIPPENTTFDKKNRFPVSTLLEDRGRHGVV